MRKRFFSLIEKMKLYVPLEKGECGAFAQEELLRLLAKLGVEVSVAGKSAGLVFSLVTQESSPGKIGRRILGKVRSNGFVVDVRDTGVTFAANTEKGLLNSVYALIEDLGISYLMPGEDNEYIAPEAPFALECGLRIRNMECSHIGVTCEFAAAADEDYTGEEWMEYYCKLRIDFIARHAGGKVENHPKYGFIFGHGAHEFHHLLPKDFKDEHPETCRQSQPDDFCGQRVNDFNFCYSSETAWREIERNFRRYAEQYSELDHLTLEFADLPGGGHCLCANCRHYSASDMQAIVMNRFAEIAEKLGLKATVQMNAYHDTMMPSVMFPPRKNIRIMFAPRERCWAHALDAPGCRRNRYYLECLKEWKRHAFSHTEYRTGVGYYTDQILFRGLYPFFPDVIAGDLKCMARNGINEFLTLQVGGRILQPDFNLIFFAAASWDLSLTGRRFIKRMSMRLGGKKFAPVIEKYLAVRSRCFAEVLKWCDVDREVSHLDYRWLKEDESQFFRNMPGRLHLAALKLSAAAAELRKGMKDAPDRLGNLMSDEASRAEFESDVIEGMSIQQRIFSKLPAARRTREPELVRQCRDELADLSEFLKKSIIKGDKVGIGKKAYYGRFVDPWLAQDIRKKMEWCDSILKNMDEK